MKNKKVLINAIIGSIVMFIPEIFFSLNYGGIYTKSLPLFFSLVIGLIFLTCLISLTGSYYKALKIIIIFNMIYLSINHIKLLTSGEIFLLSDIKLFLTSVGIANLAKETLLEPNTYIGLVPFWIICLLLLILMREKSENNIKFDKHMDKERAILFCSTSIILIILVIPLKVKDEFILNKIYGMSEMKDYAAITTNYGYARTQGVLGRLYTDVLQNRVYPNNGYNKEEVENILLNVEENKDKKFYKKPNIILIFSESFWDINKIDEVKFSKNPVENLYKLKNEGKFIDLLSPAYGGLSANVEFELLTGGNMAFLSKGYVPFISLYSKDSSKNNPSIIKELKNNGYYTQVVFGKDYYKSDDVYERLGIDKYLDVDNPKYYKGYYNSDEYLTDLAIEAIEKTQEPLFYMTVTIQSHMPYNIEKYNKYDIEIKESLLGKKETEKILSYAQGIYDADKQLGRLYDYIKKSDEETMIIFLGDHLPYLNIDNKDIFESLKYFNTSNEINNTFRKYNTQALILTNYDVGDNKRYEIMSSDYLLTYVINNMDIKISNYFKCIENFRKDLKALNQFINIDGDGNLCFNTNSSDNIRKIYNLRHSIQYYNFFDKK